MYVQVPVPEQDLMAVYELLLTRSGHPAAVAAPAVVTNDRPSADKNPNDEGIDRPESHVYRRVTDDGRAALEWLAINRGEVTYNEFQNGSGVPNLGAALQSIAIRTKDERSAPLVEKRRDSKTNRYLYSMNPRAAAIIQQLVSERAS